MGEAVVEFQQRAIERGDGGGIGKVDRVAGERVGLHERAQIRRCGDQAGKVVRRAVDVARVQFAGGVVLCFWRRRFQKRRVKVKRPRGQACDEQPIRLTFPACGAPALSVVLFAGTDKPACIALLNPGATSPGYFHAWRGNRGRRCGLGSRGFRRRYDRCPAP
jgi:hypothetical protein